MSKISAVIITYNEEKYIEQCIKSAKNVADEIVVVDSYSTDRTKEICLSQGVRFIEHPFNGYRDQKNFALSQAAYDYVLSLDADEALSPQLEKTIHTIKHDFRYDGYKFRRLNNFCGRWMYHTSLSPDRKIRLFNRKKARWDGLNIHEKIILDNPESCILIEGNLLHWLYDSYEESIEKINSYTSLLAVEYYRENIKFNIKKLLIDPSWRFFHSYFIKVGFLDGFDGYAVSKILATTCFLKYLKLRNLYILEKKERTATIHGSIHSSVSKPGNGKKLKSPISIGFDAKRAFYNFSGLGNYSRNLLSALAIERPGNSYFLFTSKTRDRYIMKSESQFKLVEPESAVFKLIGSVWRRKYIMNDIVRQKIDIYHGLSQELPAGIEKSGIRSVVTVHDLIFMRYPEFYNWIDTKIYYWKLQHACRVSDRIVAISKQTKSDLVKFLNVPPEKITVIYQGCNSSYWEKYSDEFMQQIMTKYMLPDRYLLYVGTIEERKNLFGIVKAIHLKNIKIPVVIIGRKVERYYKTILNYISENNLNNFIFTENVQNSELPVIYRNAECFIYPSFFEGFGIPLLEALISKTPVITSKWDVLSEAAGPGSLYVDPYNPEEIGEAIIKVTGSSELREKMKNSGAEYANNFRDEIIADSYLKLYHSLLQ
jgi:glycosyltransferase involved in cell wall biosynthesis